MTPSLMNKVEDQGGTGVRGGEGGEEEEEKKERKEKNGPPTAPHRRSTAM